MTFHDELRAALAGGVERGIDELAMSVGREARVVQQHLGILRQQDEVERDDAGLWRLTGRRAPRPVARKGTEQTVVVTPAASVDDAPPQERPTFDAAVWLDGSLTIVGADVRPDGVCCLTAEQARSVLELLARGLPAQTLHPAPEPA